MSDQGWSGVRAWITKEMDMTLKDGWTSWRATLVFLTIFVITFEPFTRSTYFFRISNE